jgi:hypothetical protein
MSCKHFEELLQSHLDRDLNTVEEAELKSHLDACESCRCDALLYDSLLDNLTEDLFDVEVPSAEIMAGVHQKIRRNSLQIDNLEKVSSQPGLFGRFNLAWAVVGFAAFLFVSMGLHLGNQSPSIGRRSEVAVNTVPSVIRQPIVEVARPVVAKVNDAEGVFVCRSNSNEWKSANGDLSLHLGDRVLTGKGSDVVLYYVGRGRLTLKPDTDLQIISSGVRIRRGASWFKITKLGRGFYTETPNAVAAVRGTIYTVEVTPTLPSETSVNLFRGAVEVYPGTLENALTNEETESVVLGPGEAVQVSGQLLHGKEDIVAEEYERFGMEVPEHLATPADIAVDTAVQPVDTAATSEPADYSTTVEPDNTDLPKTVNGTEDDSLSGPSSAAVGRPR